MVSTRAEPAPPVGAAGAALRAPLEPRAPLRLSVTRGVLGLELYEPVDLGPLTVSELALTLPNLTFPVDLSGGVPVFRNRRGRLARLEVTVQLERLAAWVAPRVRAITQGEAEVRLWGLPAGFGVGLNGPRSALAFELLWAPVNQAGRFVVSNIRGAGLEGPCLGHALRALDSCVGGHGHRRGRVLVLDHAARSLLRHVLPLAGARVPDAKTARPGAFTVEDGRATLDFDDVILPPALTDEACRALELASLVESADDALADGRLEVARAGYVAALEQAPRHPEISRILAEIDLAHEGRWESALGLLVDAQAAIHAGWIAAELLAGVGDRDGARAALAEVIAQEAYGPVAARAALRLAELAEDARARMAALDEAVARAPAVEAVRWARLEARLTTGDVTGALADAEHLEAAARGARARGAVARRAAAKLAESGFVRHAGRWFERALRYVTDDPFATAGLARALVASGRAARGVALFERSIELGAQRGGGDPDAALDLARLLANEYRDLPAAIARVRSVTTASPHVVEARALEARWRSAIGDRAGASLAHARMRDAVELTVRPESSWATWLVEAARFERDVQRDHFAAERHLAVALRLAPQDETVQRLFREVAAVTARRRRHDRSGPLAEDTPPLRARDDRGEAVPAVGDAASAAGGEAADSAPPTTGRAGLLADAAPAAFDVDVDDADVDAAEVADEVERLEATLRASPDDTEAALRLAVLLERQGRDDALFALVSARIEDANAAERERWTPIADAVLRRLEQTAAAAGRAGEAQLYAEFRRRLAAT